MIVFVDVDDPAKVISPPLTLWALVAVGTITAYQSDGVSEPRNGLASPRLSAIVLLFRLAHLVTLAASI